MSDNPKKIPPEDEGLFAELRGMGKTAFDTARAGASEAVDSTLRGAHEVEVAITEGYKTFEGFVGRDRIAGAAAGAKLGALIMAKPTPFIAHSITLGAVVGAGIGFALGPKVLERYRKANGNDNDENAAPPPAKPGDPAP